MQKQPLAVYIHWPFCKSKCPYCDFNSHVRDSVEQERWRAALLKELEHMAEKLSGRQVTSIFFGGGTPSLMPPGTAEALIDRVQQLWQVANNIEITLEANPTSVETNTFPDFARAGINRVSLGVQSLNDEELKFLGRGHSSKEALAAIDLARTTFERYSFDLIYARPRQTLENWEQELVQALKYTGGHLSLYQLTIEENTAFHHAYKQHQFTLPDEELAARLYRLTDDLTAAHGLRSYEVSNYAKPGEESRHNLSYWKGDDYVGIGPGAHGRLTLIPSPLEGEGQGGGRLAHVVGEPHPLTPSLKGRGERRIATQTLKSPERWLENVEKQGHAIEIWENVSREQEIEERVMMGLRLSDGISHEEFKKQTGVEMHDAVIPRKRDFYTKKGLLTDAPERLQATPSGRLVLNRLLAELLA